MDIMNRLFSEQKKKKIIQIIFYIQWIQTISIMHYYVVSIITVRHRLHILNSPIFCICMHKHLSLEILWQCSHTSVCHIETSQRKKPFTYVGGGEQNTAVDVADIIGFATRSAPVRQTAPCFVVVASSSFSFTKVDNTCDFVSSHSDRCRQ